MGTEYKTTIGLEIHAELKTATKMFCGCVNDPLEKTPNKNVCPICLAHPGTLPAINKKAVEEVVRVGYALGGKINEQSQFDRKSYFYPDLPKGYQISQYENPFVKGGKLVGVEITRVHLEEDTARLTHGKDGALVDYNRAGLPLMELVTEPVIGDADKASEFAKELQLILRYLGASDADLEKGQMRVEPNISIAPSGSKELGTKVEIKNIGSFKSVRGAIAYEVERQKKVLEGGGKIVQETRGWDDVKGETFSQRMKEEADDYRYMPEPDLPQIDFSVGEEINLKGLELSVPELPTNKRERFTKEYGFKSPDALERMIKDRGEAEFFEEVMSEIGGDKKAIETIVNYIDSDLVGLMKKKKTSWEDLKITPENFGELITRLKDGKVSTRSAKDILGEMFETGVDPDNVIKEKGLEQISDESEIVNVVKEVIAENEKAVEDYKKGKETAVKFLIGQAMAKLRGRGSPELLEKLFLEHLPK